MRPQKITFGDMREKGVRGVLVYCADYHCSHSLALSADHWADEVRRSDVEPRFVCGACGQRGADVRPDFEPAKMGTGTRCHAWPWWHPLTQVVGPAERRKPWCWRRTALLGRPLEGLLDLWGRTDWVQVAGRLQGHERPGSRLCALGAARSSA